MDFTKIRYKQTIDFPNENGFQKGMIHVVDETKPKEWFMKYPECFQEVQWYEGLTYKNEKELPLYVKFIWKNDPEEVLKVTGWLYGNSLSDEMKKLGNVRGFRHETSDSQVFPRVSLNGWLPATEEEYENYKSKNK